MMRGIHHVSVLSSDAQKAYDFYHDILGLNLTMKTVNQEETSMYHLFFGDDIGQEGTEFTVFEMKDFQTNQFGTNAIERVMFSVKEEESLSFWQKRFETWGVTHYGVENYHHYQMLRFEDFDGQRLGLVVQSDVKNEHAASHPDIPNNHLIQGIAFVYLRLRYPSATGHFLETYFDFEKVAAYHLLHLPVTVYRPKDYPVTHELHLIEDKVSPLEIIGTGGIHHLALGIDNIASLNRLKRELSDRAIMQSEIKEREFFTSIYLRDPNQILFEVATPPTLNYQEKNNVGVKWSEQALVLPEFLENQRQAIEKKLKEQER